MQEAFYKSAGSLYSSQRTADTSVIGLSRMALASATKHKAQTLSVLVVDDSEIARQRMAAILREASIEVHVLPSPIGATRAIMNHGIGIVVADVMMPGMRGDRLAALFRSNPRFRNVGVILVSGADDVELHGLAVDAKADAVLRKSELRELPALIHKVWKRVQRG